MPPHIPITTPFTILSHVDADLALARALQEQEMENGDGSDSEEPYEEEEAELSGDSEEPYVDQGSVEGSDLGDFVDDEEYARALQIDLRDFAEEQGAEMGRILKKIGGLWKMLRFLIKGLGLTPTPADEAGWGSPEEEPPRSLCHSRHDFHDLVEGLTAETRRMGKKMNGLSKMVRFIIKGHKLTPAPAEEADWESPEEHDRVLRDAEERDFADRDTRRVLHELVEEERAKMRWMWKELSGSSKLARFIIKGLTLGPTPAEEAEWESSEEEPPRRSL